MYSDAILRALFFQVTILNKNNYEWTYANEETKILYSW